MTQALQHAVKSTPYWWDDCIFPSLPVREVGKTCNVAIVGGWYTGLSAAIELARAGRHVQLFDRQALGQAASSRNGGMASGSIRPGAALAELIDATKLIYIDTNCKTNSYIDRMSTLIGSEWCST
ncbi:FAD-dependent oxidoreductase [Pararhizobium sp. LjRoot255]|uniref:FAD-dependent oxidoreductase n=1 Tax=Pararhizobium sp. LjRoot255 TaxID=3342298 RepID=UPI003ED0096A